MNKTDLTISVPLTDYLENTNNIENYENAFQIDLNPQDKDYDKNVELVKYNLIVIREAFRAVCNLNTFKQHINMEMFYRALGFQQYQEILDSDSIVEKKLKEKFNMQEKKKASDAFTYMLERDFLTKNANYQNMVFALLKAGVPRQYLCDKKIVPFSVIKKRDRKIHSNYTKNEEHLETLLCIYFSYRNDANDNKAKGKTTRGNGAVKVSLLNEIDTLLFNEYINGDDELLLIITACVRLIQNHFKTDELVLWKTTEALKTFMRQNMLPDTLSAENSFVNSKDFADFITTLAETVNTVEEEFPEFYAVAQQMKENKSAQSIMNEICNNLKALNDMDLTSSDANSDSCINMLKEISETMKNIYYKME